MSSPPTGSSPDGGPPGRRRWSSALVLGAVLTLLLVAGIALVPALVRPGRSSAGPLPVRAVGTASQRSPVGSSGRPGGTGGAEPTGAPVQGAVPRPPAPQPSAHASSSVPGGAPTPVLGLVGNSLYAVDLATGTGRCTATVRRPRPPLPDELLAPYLRTVVNCLVAAFRAPLARRGFTVTTPRVRTYGRSVSTPCGRLRATGNPAFYCAGTIYWPVSSDDGQQAYTYARLGYVGLVAHEFGHHLQAVTGMLPDYAHRYHATDRTGRDALSRRLELQAQCFEGVFLSHDSSGLRLRRRDRTELREWHSFTGDEDPPAGRRPDHGTSRAQMHWLERGLDGSDFGRCDTWSASRRSVR